MMTNPVFRRAFEARCIEWFGTITPTDAHLVPDNPVPDLRRLGSFIAAKATIAAPLPVSLGRLAAAPK
eukprot:707641-Heterocapsa_arctica.AAC.1